MKNILNKFFNWIKKSEIDYRKKYNLPEDACISCNGDGYVYDSNHGEINHKCFYCDGTGKVKKI